MAEGPITARQLKRLQTLWGIFWKAMPGGPQPMRCSREARLAWLMSKVGRHLDSSKDLTLVEASNIIDQLQKAVPPEAVKRLGRDRAAELGRAGRRGNKSKTTSLPDARAIGAIDALLRDLGWDQERFAAFLRQRNVLGGYRSKISTLGDANRARWALKGVLRHCSGAPRRGGSGAGPQRPASTKAEEILAK